MLDDDLFERYIKTQRLLKEFSDSSKRKMGGGGGGGVGVAGGEGWIERKNNNNTSTTAMMINNINASMMRIKRLVDSMSTRMDTIYRLKSLDPVEFGNIQGTLSNIEGALLDVKRSLLNVADGGF